MTDYVERRPELIVISG